MSSQNLANQEANNEREENQDLTTLNDIDLALSSGFDMNKINMPHYIQKH